MQWFLALILGLNLLIGMYGTLKKHSISDVRTHEVRAEQIQQVPLTLQSNVSATQKSPKLTPSTLTAKTVSGQPIINTVKAKAPKIADIASSCLQWGPIDEQQLKRIKDGLLLIKIKAEYVSEVREKIPDNRYSYRVLYPPLPSQTETTELSSELMEMGFENYIVKNTNFVGYLSLGLFSKEDTAKRLVEELMAAGYDQAEITRHRPQANKVTLSFKTLGTRQIEQLKILQKQLTPDISLKTCR
jgi:hypothetical protein